MVWRSRYDKWSNDFFLKLPFKSHFKNHFKSSSVLLQPHWPMWVFHVRCPSESVLEDVNIISGKCLSEDIYKVICNKYNSMKETIVTFTYSEKHISYIHSTSTFDKNITKQLFLFCPSNHWQMDIISRSLHYSSIWSYRTPHWWRISGLGTNRMTGICWPPWEQSPIHPDNDKTVFCVVNKRNCIVKNKHKYLPSLNMSNIIVSWTSLMLLLGNSPDSRVNTWFLQHYNVSWLSMSDIWHLWHPILN